MLASAAAITAPAAPAAIPTTTGKAASLRLAESGESTSGRRRPRCGPDDDIGHDFSAFLELAVEKLRVLPVTDARAYTHRSQLIVLVEPDPPGAFDRRKG